MEWSFDISWPGVVLFVLMAVVGYKLGIEIVIERKKT